MNLKYNLVDKDYKYKGKVKHLFEHAFPIVERPPFNMLMSFRHNEMYGVEDNGEFVGLVDLLIYEDIVYIFFLAIKKTFRGKGIGTQILNDVAKKYKNYRLYLLAENPNIESDNKKERLSRIKFYEHAGFINSNKCVIEFDVNYLILYKDKEVSKEEFLKGMKYLLGEERYNNYYVHHVK